MLPHVIPRRMVRPMSILTLAVLALAVLLGPWALMPRRRNEAEIHGVLRLLWNINALICAFWYRLAAERMAPLPEHGPAILISNHTSQVDAMLLQASCRRVLGFLIAQEYYDYWLFRWICRRLGCIPVRRDGRDLAATRAALRALEHGRVVPMFPEGRILPTGGRELGEPRPGVAFIVLHAKVPVIPAYIWGTPATNSFLTALATPTAAYVIYGDPIDVRRLAPQGPVDHEALETLSDRLMDAIRALRDQVRETGQEPVGVEAPVAGAWADGSDGTRQSEGAPGTLSGDRSAVRRA
jgi:1-acyl-sn-glycerol-3-phosphate acyltransferase